MFLTPAFSSLAVSPRSSLLTSVSVAVHTGSGGKGAHSQASGGGGGGSESFLGKMHLGGFKASAASGGKVSSEEEAHALWEAMAMASVGGPPSDGKTKVRPTPKDTLRNRYAIRSDSI